MKADNFPSSAVKYIATSKKNARSEIMLEDVIRHIREGG